MIRYAFKKQVYHFELVNNLYPVIYCPAVNFKLTNIELGPFAICFKGMRYFNNDNNKLLIDV